MNRIWRYSSYVNFASTGGHGFVSATYSRRAICRAISHTLSKLNGSAVRSACDVATCDDVGDDAGAVLEADIETDAEAVVVAKPSENTEVMLAANRLDDALAKNRRRDRPSRCVENADERSLPSFTFFSRGKADLPMGEFVL